VLGLAPGASVYGGGGGSGRNDESDLELVRNATTGDKRAWEKLIARLEGEIRRSVIHVLRRRRATLNGQDIDDYVQNVFELLVQRDYHVLKTWDPARGGSLSTFIGLVAKRLTYSTLRTGKRGAWLEDPTEDGSIDAQIEAPAPSPERLVIDKLSLAKLLDRIYEELVPHRVLMFEFLFIEDHSAEEAAQRFATTPNAIYTWISRLRVLIRRLEAELEPEEPSDE
jgi:DNA-directed RNA polymerase specialized sigma24 family protein